jgi:hypothetical protein
MGTEIAKKDNRSKTSLLEKIDDRIVSAASPEEAEIWVELRRKLLEQTIVERESRYKWGFALLAFAVGSVLGVSGHDVFGIFVAGAGLSVFAKDWVIAWIKRGGRDEEAE